MTAARVYTHPVKRPNFIEAARWIGNDDDLSLEVDYRDQNDILRTIVLVTEAGTSNARVFPPSSWDLTDLHRDTLVAHVRMATMIAKAPVGSQEFEDTFVIGEKNFQTSVGTVKITQCDHVDDITVNVTFGPGTGQNPTITHAITHDELTEYAFAPSTQLRIIAGALKYEFPNYEHDYPSTTLSQAQKNNVISFLTGSSFQPWV